MFHAQNGLYFERLPDGSVRIIKNEDASPGALLVMEEVVSPDSWASIMASMCTPGETAETFRKASNFHEFGRCELPTAI